MAKVEVDGGYVTRALCKFRFGTLAGILGVLVGLASLQLYLTKESIDQSQLSGKKADEVSSKFDAHTAVEEVNNKHVSQTLLEIKTDVRDLKTRHFEPVGGI